MQFSSIQFSSIQFNSVQFSSVSVQFSSVQFSSVQFSSVQFSFSSAQLSFSSVQFTVCWHSFDGFDFCTITLDCEQSAWFYGLPVYEDSAGPATACITTNVCSGQSHILAQMLYKKRAWFHIMFVCGTVYCHWNFHRYLPLKKVEKISLNGGLNSFFSWLVKLYLSLVKFFVNFIYTLFYPLT